MKDRIYWKRNRSLSSSKTSNICILSSYDCTVSVIRSFPDNILLSRNCRHASLMTSQHWQTCGYRCNCDEGVYPGYHHIISVVLLLVSLSSGVRLALVTIVFFFIFSLTMFSHRQSPAPSISCCCSPFSSDSYQISLNAVFPSHSWSSSPPFSLHFLCVFVSFPLLFFPHDQSISTYSSPLFFLNVPVEVMDLLFCNVTFLCT